MDGRDRFLRLRPGQTKGSLLILILGWSVQGGRWEGIWKERELLREAKIEMHFVQTCRHRDFAVRVRGGLPSPAPNGPADSEWAVQSLRGADTFSGQRLGLGLDSCTRQGLLSLGEGVECPGV